MNEEQANPQATVPKEAQKWGMLCHLSALAGFVIIPLGHVVIPLLHILAPLVIWLMKKDEHPFIDEQGKESLNFQISVTIYSLVAFPFTFILIGIPVIIALAVADVVLVIIASMKVSNGEGYRYPFTLRLIK